MGDGEDGPTHQPVEQLISLRAIPGLVVLRPGDANEVVEAYRYIMQLRHEPAVLALSRQPLPTLDRTRYASAAGVATRAYVLADPPGGNPEVILIATGSEVCLAVEAHEKLLAEGSARASCRCRRGTSSSTRRSEYRDSVLPPKVTARVAIEQGSTLGWERYVGTTGPSHRHEDVRSVGPAQRAATQIRLRAGPRRRRRERAIEAVRSGNWRRPNQCESRKLEKMKARRIRAFPPCTNFVILPFRGFRDSHFDFRLGG